LHQKAKTENEREKSRKFHGTMITGLTLRYHVLEKNDELQQKKIRTFDQTEHVVCLIWKAEKPTGSSTAASAQINQTPAGSNWKGNYCKTM